MAASASAYTTTSTASPHHPSSAQGAWNFSVPLSGNYDNSHRSENPSTGTSPPVRDLSPSHTFRPAPQRAESADSRTPARPLTHRKSGPLQSAGRVNQLSRKRSDISAVPSDSDSLLDLYTNQPQARNGGGNNTMAPKRKLTANGAQGGPIGVGEDRDAWIHRDKLMQIESKELEEAGFKVPRSMSRASSTGPGSRDRSRSRGKLHDEYAEDDMPAIDNTLHSRYSSKDLREERNRRAAHHVPAEEVEEVEEEYEDRRAWDLRTPQEIEADRERARSGSRPGLSRLPVARDSPKPVPNVLAERDSPLTRSRQGSSAAGNSILEPAIIFNRHGRSGSVGSQVLLDDMDPISPHNGSPTKPGKSPSKATPTGKKGSTTTPGSRNTSQTKNRQSSQSNTKRPGTSGGISRPSTSHRPEGEAPWIATMYKPDPSLPPDQQIIPTHAKRMAQEQWEKEGKTGTIYDREFRLLNSAAFPPKPSPNASPAEHEKKEQQDQWPLQQSSLPSPKPASESGRPGTSGGYKVMPNITSPQPPPARPIPSPVPAPPSKERDPNSNPPPEEPKQKRGCCCIVM